MWPKTILLLAAAVFSYGQSTAGEQLARARQLVADNKLLEAAGVYEQLIRSNPHDVSLRVNLAVVLFKANRYEATIPVCLDGLRIRSDSAPLWMFLGASYFQLHRTPEAVEPLQRAVDLLPSERNSRLMLGEALLLTGRYRDALPHLQTAARLLPESPRVWYALERTFSALAGQESDAIEAQAAESAVWFALAGDAAFDKERYGLALRYYGKALQLRPDLPGIRESITETYKAAGHPEWTAGSTSACAASRMLCVLFRREYEAALQLAGTADEPDARYVRAKACRGLASSAYARLAALPDSMQLHELKARHLDDLGRFRAAAEEWRVALRMSPGNAPVEEGLAVALMNARDNASAEPILQQLARREPSRASLLVLAGRNLLALEKPQEAVPWFRRALEAEPSNAAAHAGLGEALLRTGSPQDAVTHLAASLGDDADGTRHYQLARAYRALGSSDKALKLMAEYKSRQLAAEKNRNDLEVEVTAPESARHD